MLYWKRWGVSRKTRSSTLLMTDITIFFFITGNLGATDPYWNPHPATPIVVILEILETTVATIIIL